MPSKNVVDFANQVKSYVDGGINDVYKANSILGAKNLYKFQYSDVADNAGGTHTISDGELTITCTATRNSGTYCMNTRLRQKFAFLENIPCIFSCEYKSTIACAGLIVGEEVTMATEWTKKEVVINDPSNIGNIEFYNRDTTQTPVISVRKFMLRIATDTDDSYFTYAMTNSQLMGEVKEITPSDPTHFTDFKGHYVVVGNFCIIMASYIKTDTSSYGLFILSEMQMADDYINTAPFVIGKGASNADIICFNNTTWNRVEFQEKTLTAQANKSFIHVVIPIKS